MRHAPQLITYADRFAGDLRGLRSLLDGPLAGAFGGVHVLPFYVAIDGADAGFDPSDHTAVDPRVGTWADIARLAERYEVMADVIVNHVADTAPAYLDWLQHGRASVFDGMFLTYDAVFPSGATEADLTRVYRPRPGLPFTRTRLGDGSIRLVWTTFTPHQIDLDVEHPAAQHHLTAVLDTLAGAGVTLVRLDAVGYAVKRAGTTCFMIPETHAFVDRLVEQCHDRGMRVLLEIHGYHRDQIEIAERVDLVYDFALPPLVLDALFRADASVLREWLAIRPANAVNVLDTHDGIGVIDVAPDPTDPTRRGLLPLERVEELAREIHERCGGTSHVRRTAGGALDIYQVDCTYYDALGRDDDRYLLARLVQCLLPGIPQIYYVGLLAGTNDVERFERTGVPRDLNRHHYTAAEVAAALGEPVVQRQLEMLRWRAACPAFDGGFQVLDAPAHELRLRWETSDGHRLDAALDLAAGSYELLERTPAGVTSRTSNPPKG